jgi:hypothetical protein
MRELVGPASTRQRSRLQRSDHEDHVPPWPHTVTLHAPDAHFLIEDLAYLYVCEFPSMIPCSQAGRWWLP